ncbi:MAG: S41 family peptidase, partial [Bacteroidales bacterium]
VLLYHDRKGMEDTWRKHHESSVTRDVWMATPKGNAYEYKQLTTYYGEDRNPVWAADGKSFYYLSEQKGSFNVFKRSIDGTSDVQLTQMKDHPVRFLSIANNGTLCFGYNGELYT